MLGPAQGHPDGAIVDAEGHLWSAVWGGAVARRYRPDGTIEREIAVPARNVTCLAFGGPDLNELYVTTARQDMSPADLERVPEAGSVYRAVLEDVRGLPDYALRRLTSAPGLKVGPTGGQVTDGRSLLPAARLAGEPVGQRRLVRRRGLGRRRGRGPRLRHRLPRCGRNLAIELLVVRQACELVGVDHRLLRGDFELLAARLARDVVVEPEQVIAQFRELGPIDVVGARRQPVLLRAAHPADAVVVGALAFRAGKPALPGFRFVVEQGAFVEGHASIVATNGPVAWAKLTGLMRTLPASDSRRPAARVQSPSPFAAQIASLSEPAGYFDTDNLISNERSFQQVLQDLRRRDVRGGAYIGVGPDQNFTYIAEMRPTVAFIVDVRRDNLLLHLLFKALFAQSRTRVEYLALLTGRPVPADLEPWRAAPVDKLAAYIDGAAVAPATVPGVRRRADESIARMGVPLSTEDRATIDRFHRRFIADGLSLMFQSTGRPPQSYNPTYRDLLRETDESGRQASFLASEEAFQFVKGLEAQDLIIPVVGDLSGPTAIAAIGRALEARRERLSAFYVSNVEFYLFGGGTFPRFAANLGTLPHLPNSVVIRSIFGGRYRGPTRPGDGSVSRVQAVDDLLREYAAGRIRGYGDIALR